MLTDSAIQVELQAPCLNHVLTDISETMSLRAKVIVENKISPILFAIPKLFVKLTD